ncbi:MAG: hypothetical protein KAS32_17020, partial [Candidatus Peribacteraceae bacterium]|nr:hypothetical protein [Candidatus Peribacteraceae bacterium]
MKEQNFNTGCEKSPLDIRTFAYRPTTGYVHKGGERYKPEEIKDQHRVGICTGAAGAQHSSKSLKKDFNMDWEYLCQKVFYDKNWKEGSSAFSNMRVKKNIGMLPQEYWKHTTEADRKLPYYKYIKKLQAIPLAEIDRLKTISARFKIEAYAKLADTKRNTLANAIMESDKNAGIIIRFVIGSEWWTSPIEPLSKPKNPTSGHLLIASNFTGDSFRCANEWGSNWADKGTAYWNNRNYRPTEAWMVWYKEVPEDIQKKL